MGSMDVWAESLGQTADHEVPVSQERPEGDATFTQKQPWVSTCSNEALGLFRSLCTRSAGCTLTAAMTLPGQMPPEQAFPWGSPSRILPFSPFTLFRLILSPPIIQLLAHS